MENDNKDAMKLLDRLIFLLIEYNKKAPRWRRIVGIANEGFIICITFFLWYMFLFLFSVIFLMNSHPKIFELILYGIGIVLIITFIAGECFSIRQDRGKIENIPIFISDKYLKVFLAIFIIVPIALALIGFIMVASHAFFGWFSFMN